VRALCKVAIVPVVLRAVSSESAEPLIFGQALLENGCTNGGLGCGQKTELMKKRTRWLGGDGLNMKTGWVVLFDDDDDDDDAIDAAEAVYISIGKEGRGRNEGWGEGLLDVKLCMGWGDDGLGMGWDVRSDGL